LLAVLQCAYVIEELETFKSLVKNIGKLYIASVLFTLPKAKKLQIWTLADSQRMRSTIVAASWVDAPSHKSNLLVAKQVCAMAEKYGLPVVNITFDGASDSLAKKGIDGTSCLVTELWRSKMNEVAKIERQDVITALNHRMKGYILKERVEEWQRLEAKGARDWKHSWPQKIDNYLLAYTESALHDVADVASTFVAKTTKTLNSGLVLHSAMKGIIKQNVLKCFSRLAATEKEYRLLNEKEMIVLNDADGNLIDIRRLFLASKIIAASKWKSNRNKGSLVADVAILRVWLARMLVDEDMFFQKKTNGKDFYTSPYVPGRNPSNSELPLVMTVDPDHVFKRLIKYLTTYGFGEHADRNRWITIAKDRNFNEFGIDWYKRDEQKVADAKVAVSKPIETEFRKRQWEKEADVCMIIREAWEAFDTSGISEERRAGYIERLRVYLMDIVEPVIYNEPCSEYLPQARYEERMDKSKEATEARKNLEKNCLPTGILEDLLINIYGRMFLWEELSNRQQNKLYDEAHQDDSKRLPIFNDRWRQSNDVENLFSQWKAIMGKDSQGRIQKSSPLQVSQ